MNEEFLVTSRADMERRGWNWILYISMAMPM